MKFGSHPINLAGRFLLEICALIAIGFWGWSQYDSIFQYFLGLGLPIMTAIIWGLFNVPGDPSRSGKAPVKVPGLIRLIIELSIFCLAVWALQESNKNILSAILGILVLLHYLLSLDRIKWLISRK